MTALVDRPKDGNLEYSPRVLDGAFHGGEFFFAIGDAFDNLERRHRVINADVLDAWFPPSPHVLEVITNHLEWLLRTSPPTHCEGLTRVIADSRGVDVASILPGAGSSDLIFLALRTWLSPASRALILDPTYGEYAHVLEKVIGCDTDRFLLDRTNNYAVDIDELAERVRRCYDLVVIVNPNSPTGQAIPSHELKTLILAAPEHTRFWVDETYIDYAGRAATLEPLAACHPGLVVCKSMSKVYALSGARAAYLCAQPATIATLRHVTPPWSVGLVAQVAAVAALQDPGYYEARWRETHALRRELHRQLESIEGLDVTPGIANFLLVHLPASSPTAADLADRCRARGLFVRDARLMGASIGERTLRLAVKDGETNARMVEILGEAIHGGASQE